MAKFIEDYPAHELARIKNVKALKETGAMESFIGPHGLFPSPFPFALVCEKEGKEFQIPIPHLHPKESEVLFAGDSGTLVIPGWFAATIFVN